MYIHIYIYVINPFERLGMTDVLYVGHLAAGVWDHLKGAVGMVVGRCPVVAPELNDSKCHYSPYIGPKLMTE